MKEGRMEGRARMVRRGEKGKSEGRRRRKEE